MADLVKIPIKNPANTIGKYTKFNFVISIEGKN